MNCSVKWIATLLLGALTAAFAACSPPQEDPPKSPTTQPGNAGVTATAAIEEKSEPFVARGRVTDAAGKPIAGAVVTLENTLFYRSNAEVRTGADGAYRVEIPRGSWRATAKLDRTYHDRRYRFDLAPENPDPFAGAEGGIRNFVWKLTGERPDGLGTYGDKVVVYNQPGDFSFESEGVELSLTPEGPLVDGSKGGVITSKLVSTGDGPAVSDVPLGRYTIKARLAPKDQPAELLLVRIRSRGDFVPGLSADFDTPHGPTLPIHRIELEVKRP